MENRFRRFSMVTTTIMLTGFGFLVVLFMTQCKKDPIKGWTFYTDSPPMLNITSMKSLISNCEPPYPVTFSQVTENKIGTVSYFWDFGDGNTSTNQNPHHIYQVPGDYTVMFIVSNEISADTAYLPMPELALATIPVNAAFTFTHFNSNNWAPTKVMFDNGSIGANQFYWTFGDGQENNNAKPEHIFQNAGTYTVKMKAICTNGDFDEVTQLILVQAAPQRVIVDSLNLMLPSAYNSLPVYIEMYHNTTYIGRTRTITPSSYPMKFRRPQDFPGGYMFDFVQFTGNEIFKFVILHDMGVEPPILIDEIVLSPSYIQSNFYPSVYYQIETVPSKPNLFIDLYMSY